MGKTKLIDLDLYLRRLSKRAKPTHHVLDGGPVDKEEAARVHAALVSGAVDLKSIPGVAERLAASGLTVDGMRKLVLAYTKKCS